MGDVNPDPSMEEILASIKRVIAEDGRAIGSGRGRAGERADSEPPPEDDVLELSDPVSEADGLMSPNSAVASRQSLAVLAAMRQQNEVPQPAARVDDSPLEAVVRDMLRPMLKDWLDQHLPEMVEEMVAREIARITGKGL